jgi:hypothetical protein
MGVDALPIDFERAMLSTNPSFKAGIGHSGPLTRFIAAIAPILTGERPTSDSVATLLKKRKKFLGGKIAPDEFSPKT